MFYNKLWVYGETGYMFYITDPLFCKRDANMTLYIKYTRINLKNTCQRKFK